VVSLSDARDALAKLSVFVRDNLAAFPGPLEGDSLRVVEAITERVSKMAVANMHRKVQSSITNFFAPAAGVHSYAAAAGSADVLMHQSDSDQEVSVAGENATME
jgi:hypothetical protein